METDAPKEEVKESPPPPAEVRKESVPKEKTEKEDVRPQPRKKSKLAACCSFIYNKQTGEYLGRNCGSWGRICLFYLVFYIFLFAFFFAFIFILLLCLPRSHPMHTGADSLISDQPGAGVVPLLSGSSLILIESASDKDIDKNYVKPLKDLIAANEAASSGLKKCELGKTEKKDKGNCAFQAEFGPCTEDTKFGYATLQPCVAIRLNKIVDWEPTSVFSPATKTKEKVLEEIKKNPSIMPPELTEYITKQSAKYTDEAALTDFLSSVFFHCDGDLTRDKEYMGPIAYYPGPKIASYYYPYKFHAKKKAVVPFIMVQFLRPLLGVPISITCKAYSKGLSHEPNEGVGTVRFQLLLRAS